MAFKSKKRNMTVAIASDHRGFKLKNFLAGYLEKKGYAVIDFGTYSKEPCDYPDYVYPASLAVKEKKADRAIVICYTGIGSAICANKVRGIRAALVTSLKSAVLSRKHNNSNVLVLAAGELKDEYAKRVVSSWLVTEFEGGRHLRRVQKISELEKREGL